MGTRAVTRDNGGKWSAQGEEVDKVEEERMAALEESLEFQPGAERRRATGGHSRDSVEKGIGEENGLGGWRTGVAQQLDTEAVFMRGEKQAGRVRRRDEPKPVLAYERGALESGQDRAELLVRIAEAELALAEAARQLEAERQRAGRLERSLDTLRGAGGEVSQMESDERRALQLRFAGAQRFLARCAVAAANRMLLSQCFRALCLNVASAHLLADRRRFREMLQRADAQESRPRGGRPPPQIQDLCEMDSMSASLLPLHGKTV